MRHLPMLGLFGLAVVWAWLGDVSASGMANLVAAAAIVAGFFQLDKQNRATLHIQKEHLKDQLRLDLYRELGDKLQAAERSLSKVSVAYLVVVQNLEARQSGLHFIKVHNTPSSLYEPHYKAVESANDAVLLLEKYEIASYRLRTIRKSLVDAQLKLYDAHRLLMDKLYRFLPVDGVPEHVARAAGFPQTPTDKDIEELRDLLERFQGRSHDLSAFLADARTEAQNVLLGHLFDRMLPPREPGDPSLPVLRADPDD